MSFISKIDFIKKFKEKNISLFSTPDVAKVFDIKSENTLKHLLRRLSQEQIIEVLNKGKYIFLQGRSDPADFTIANFLLQPSYVSLESALSFYGLLDQFPYGITSVTAKKTREIKCRGKLYSYARIKKEYFSDFGKQDNFLIASPEKAVFDFAYFVYNGLRSKETLKDILNIHLKPALSRYLKTKAQGKFLKFISKYV